MFSLAAPIMPGKFVENLIFFGFDVFLTFAHHTPVYRLGGKSSNLLVHHLQGNISYLPVTFLVA